MSIELIKFLDAIEEEAKSVKVEKDRDWDKYLKYFKGDMWPKKRPEWKVSPVINHIGSIIERKVAYMTDTKPIMHVLARRDELTDVAQLLEDTIAALWEERNYLQALTETIYLTCIFGFAPTAVFWNQELDDGLGDIDLRVEDPRSVFFDPFCLRHYDVATKSEYLFFEHFVPTQELEFRYPKFKGLIPAFYEPESKAGRWKTLIQRIIKPKLEAGFRPAIKRSLVKEYFFKDRTLEVDEEGNVIYDGRRPRLKYPGGRYVIRCGNLILLDEPNSYIDGTYPMEILSWHFDPDSAIGVSEIENLYSMQSVYNKMVEVIVENAMLMTNAIWIGDIDALTPEDWKNLRNKSGDFVRVRPGKKLGRVPPPPLPPYTREVVLYLEQELEKISGMLDVTRGERRGITSALAIESLQMAAQSVIRLKARALESFLQRLGQKLISRILQYYDEDRIFYFLGADGKKFEQFRFLKSRLVEGLESAYGTYDRLAIARRALRDLQFKIVPGSSLAIAKMPKIYMALTLYRLGVIDDEALLEVVEWPNREEVLQRAREQRRVRPIRGRRVKLPEAPIRAIEKEMKRGVRIEPF